MGFLDVTLHYGIEGVNSLFCLYNVMPPEGLAMWHQRCEKTSYTIVRKVTGRNLLLLRVGKYCVSATLSKLLGATYVCASMGT